MSLTYRFFVGDKRVSTAVLTKKGAFLQVYPRKELFSSESTWRDRWTYVYPVRVETSLSKLSLHTKKTVEEIKEDDWTFSSALTFTAPAGTYYIGDISYVLSDDMYDKIFRNVGGYDPGLYQKKESPDFFLVDGTAFGDGLYKSSDLKEFAVDAGIIGIVPLSLVSESGSCGGHFYTFSEPVTCTFGGGRFFFTSGLHTHLCINTTGEDDDA